MEIFLRKSLTVIVKIVTYFHKNLDRAWASVLPKILLASRLLETSKFSGNMV